MLVYLHIIFSFIFAGILYPFIDSYSWIVFLSGFIFDIDHYYYYMLKKRNINPINAYFYCFPGTRVYEKHNDVLHIFHTLEFWILLVVLWALFDRVFLFILIGLMFHMILDAIDLYLKWGGLKARAWSLIGWVKRH